MEILLKILAAYLAGSVIGALLVGRFIGHVDIRQMGSGNAGGTNALRTQGWWFALLVVVVDVGKGALAAGWLPFISIPGLDGQTLMSQQSLQALCAAAAVAGHVFPVYHRFRGGKGAATLVGALIFMSWEALLVVLLSWLLVVAATGYVGLATMLAVVSATLYIALMGEAGLPLLLFMSGMSVFIAFTHRSNIARMRAGTENRMHRFGPQGRERERRKNG